MPKFSVNATVIGSKHIGVFEADTAEKAIEIAQEQAWVSVCHQCSHEINDPQLERFTADPVETKGEGQ